MRYNKLVFLIFLIFSLQACSQDNAQKRNIDTTLANTIKDMKYKELTPEEERVIINKGTEAPYIGKYVKNKDKGTYVCKRCQASLYSSDSKFDSHCGWPSFDDELPGAVKRIPDADGSRTEIICNNCGAHLGHVFIGEGFTDKDTRHCVNSISLEFIPAENDSKQE